MLHEKELRDQVLIVRLPESTKAELRRVAAQNRRTMTAETEIALEKHFYVSQRPSAATSA